MSSHSPSPSPASLRPTTLSTDPTAVAPTFPHRSPPASAASASAASRSSTATPTKGNKRIQQLPSTPTASSRIAAAANLSSPLASPRTQPLPPGGVPDAQPSPPATPLPAPPPAPVPPLPRRPSYSSFTLLSGLRSLNVGAVQWLLERGARLADEEAEHGCHLLDIVWDMVRDDRVVDQGGEDELRGSGKRSSNKADPHPARLRRAASSKAATASDSFSCSIRPARDDGDIKRPSLDRRKSTPLPRQSVATAVDEPLPSSSSTYLALPPLATVRVRRGPVPFSATLSSLLLLLMPHSAALKVPTLPTSPPPTLSALHALTAFCCYLQPLLLTLHSNSSALALTHAHILDDVSHTLTAITAQQQREQDEEGGGGISARQRIAAAEVRHSQLRAEVQREKAELDRELMDYLRSRAADVAKEAVWAAERAKQQATKLANEQRRASDEEKERRRLQRRIASMEVRYDDTQRLITESNQRCSLLAQQTCAFSSQLSLLNAALAAERSKSTQDSLDLAAVRSAQQQHCMIAFRPRAELFRKPLLRDYHSQLRLILPSSHAAPGLAVQCSEVVPHSQRPSWSDWSVQVGAVGGVSSRWRLEIWDVVDWPSGTRHESRVCGCWSSVSELLMEAGEDVELRMMSGEADDEGDHVGTLWLSGVRMAYID